MKDKQERNKALKKVYDKVKTYDDLVKTNIMFLKGDIPATWYYFEKWGTGGDQQTHATAPITKSLLAIHDAGIFTEGGQSAHCHKKKYYAPWHDANIVATEQRSFLAGVMPVELARELLPILKADKRIYVEMIFPQNEGNFSNIPYKHVADGWPKEFTATRVKTSEGKWISELKGSDEQDYKIKMKYYNTNRKFPNVDKILRQQAVFEIDARTYCKGPEVTTILLEALDKSRAAPL
jgi:hypothetical protein